MRADNCEEKSSEKRHVVHTAGSNNLGAPDPGVLLHGFESLDERDGANVTNTNVTAGAYVLRKRMRSNTTKRYER
jgi:hypothetical protein